MTSPVNATASTSPPKPGAVTTVSVATTLSRIKGEQSLPAKQVNEAIKTLLNISRCGFIEGDLDENLLEFLFSDLLKNPQHEKTEPLLSCISLICSKKCIDRNMKKHLSVKLLRLILKLTRHSSSTIPLKVRAYSILEKQEITKEEFLELEIELLQCIREVNVGEEWELKIKILNFYISLLNKCSSEMFRKRVDFLWPLVEDYPKHLPTETRTELHKYFLAILAGCKDDATLNDLISSFTIEALKSFLKTNFSHSDDIWYKIFANLVRTKLGKEIILGNKLFVDSIKNKASSNDFAFITKLQLFGFQEEDESPGSTSTNDNKKSDVGEEYDLKNTIRILNLVDSRVKTLHQQHTNSDDIYFGYRLVTPLSTLLMLIKTKPVEKMTDFTRLFLQSQLIGRILNYAFENYDFQLVFKTTEICFRLGVRTQDRESIYRCLVNTKVIQRLEKLIHQQDTSVSPSSSSSSSNSAPLVSSSNKEIILEICSWKLMSEIDLSQSVQALEKVTRCEAKVCEKLLHMHNYNLSLAIQNFFHVKEHFVEGSNQEVIERIFQTANSQDDKTEDDEEDDDQLERVSAEEEELLVSDQTTSSSQPSQPLPPPSSPPNSSSSSKQQKVEKTPEVLSELAALPPPPPPPHSPPPSPPRDAATNNNKEEEEEAEIDDDEDYQEEQGSESEDIVTERKRTNTTGSRRFKKINRKSRVVW